MDKAELRLELLKVMIPKAAQVGITQPETIVNACTHFENYVVGSEKDGVSPASAPPKPKRSPRKGQAQSKAQEGSSTPDEDQDKS